MLSFRVSFIVLIPTLFAGEIEREGGREGGRERERERERGKEKETEIGREKLIRPPHLVFYLYFQLLINHHVSFHALFASLLCYAYGHYIFHIYIVSSFCWTSRCRALKRGRGSGVRCCPGRPPSPMTLILPSWVANTCLLPVRGIVCQTRLPVCEAAGACLQGLRQSGR